jgi:glutathione peroxidase
MGIIKSGVINRIYGGLTGCSLDSAERLYPGELSLASGGSLDLQQYAGKVVLVVNTASKCGFTGQYDGLEEIYQRYAARGFEILGCPSNDFANQEPGSDEEVQSFCRINHGVTFKLLPKGSVRGAQKQQLFVFLTEKGPVDLCGEVRWNFEKFLIDRDGRLIGRWRSYVAPRSRSLRRAIEGALETR